MRYPRIIGQNIQLAMKKSNITVTSVAEKLGYSEKDMYRIIEGALLVDASELKDISDVLGVDFEYLSEQKDEEEYRELIHCMGEYHSVDNKDKILDYIDLYIELAEAIG